MRKKSIFFYEIFILVMMSSNNLNYVKVEREYYEND